MFSESLPNIIIATLTGIAPIVAVIATHSMSRTGSRKQDMIRTYRKQLFRIFEPLQILFEKYGQNDTDELLKGVEKIIYKNYSLLPLILLNEYKHITSERDTSIIKLGEIVSTYYNFTKRMLSYPYDGKAIKNKCLEQREQNFIKARKQKAVAVGSIFLLIYIPFMIWLGNTKEIPFLVGAGMIAFVAFYIMYSILYGLLLLLEKKPDHAMRRIWQYVKNLFIKSWAIVKSMIMPIKMKIHAMLNKSH